MNSECHEQVLNKLTIINTKVSAKQEDVSSNHHESKLIKINQVITINQDESCNRHESRRTKESQ